jgi:hypothetical protein
VQKYAQKYAKKYAEYAKNTQFSRPIRVSARIRRIRQKNTQNTQNRGFKKEYAEYVLPTLLMINIRYILPSQYISVHPPNFFMQ